MTSSVGSERGDRYSRSMSYNVQRLQDSLNMHLGVAEKAEFVDILNEFQIRRDIPDFVKRLKLLLDTPAKKQLLALIIKVIPLSDLEEFEQCLKGRGRRFNTMPVKQSKKQRSRPPLTESVSATQLKSKRHKEGKSGKSKEKNQTDSSKSHSKDGTASELSKFFKFSSESGHNNMKRIQICHRVGTEDGFGFSIRGGAEFRIGIYVSMVDKGGMAEKQGLEPGDLLVEVNNISFNNISHNEAAKIIRCSTKLDMLISRIGRIPGSFVVHQMYKWVNASGRPVSPPQEIEHIGLLDSAGKKSGFALLKGPDERKINITVEKDESLGLMIRGGREFGLGIYISGVDQASLADQAGMKIGDQILDVNGRSFLDITHAEAVNMLKTSKYLMFTTKSVGKLPYARTKIDQTSWMSKTQKRKLRQRTDSQTSDGSVSLDSSKNSAFRKGIGSQLMYNTAISTRWDAIENQALQLLNDAEQGTLRYYLSEYQAGFITVDGLAMASFELLNTKAKMSLMDEIRNWVHNRDVHKFDMLLQRRQAQQRGSLTALHLSRFSDHNSSSLDGHKPLPERLHRPYKVMSAPASRAATVSQRSGHSHRPISEWELEPLRQAIHQIDDQFQHENVSKHERKSEFQRQRSLSRELLKSPSPTLLKSSVSSRRSLSEETLTPVYIDTTSDLPHSSGHRCKTTPRSRSSSASRKTRTWNSYSHRQRSGSNSSSLGKRFRSVEDVRLPNRKITPYPSRWNSTEDIHRNLSCETFNQLAGLDTSQTPSQSTHFINVDVHDLPGQHIEGSPSDDSGVEVNGHIPSEPSNNHQVTISAENPVNINDVLHNRSFVSPSLHDYSVKSNHSTLTSRSNQSRKSIIAQTNQRQDDFIDATSSLKFQSSSASQKHLKPPVEIRINDGYVSIDTMSLDSYSPMNQKTRGYVHKAIGGSGRRSMLDTDDEGDEEDFEDEDTLESSSDNGDHTHFYTIHSHQAQQEAKKIEEAKKRYGDVPLYIIPVYKLKPTLGMAIEGGANTKQPVPRVINLQPGGSAYESGGLKVGHKILEVNGKPLIGLEHITAAKTVAEAFKNNSEDDMELLVTDSDSVLKQE